MAISSLKATFYPIMGDPTYIQEDSFCSKMNTMVELYVSPEVAIRFPFSLIVTAKPKCTKDSKS